MQTNLNVFCQQQGVLTRLSLCASISRQCLWGITFHWFICILFCMCMHSPVQLLPYLCPLCKYFSMHFSLTWMHLQNMKSVPGNKAQFGLPFLFFFLYVFWKSTEKSGDLLLCCSHQPLSALPQPAKGCGLYSRSRSRFILDSYCMPATPHHGAVAPKPPCGGNSFWQLLFLTSFFPSWLQNMRISVSVRDDRVKNCPDQSVYLLLQFPLTGDPKRPPLWSSNSTPDPDRELCYLLTSDLYPISDFFFIFPLQNNCHILIMTHPENDSISALSFVSTQNGLMEKITETCPEINCTVSEQILPEGRCCNVCRGTSHFLIQSLQ